MYNLNHKEERRMEKRQYLKSEWWRINQRHITVKLHKAPQFLILSTREKKQIIYKEEIIRLIVDFSVTTIEARGQWDNILSVPREK